MRKVAPSAYRSWPGLSRPFALLARPGLGQDRPMRHQRLVFGLSLLMVHPALACAGGDAVESGVAGSGSSSGSHSSGPGGGDLTSSVSSTGSSGSNGTGGG